MASSKTTFWLPFKMIQHQPRGLIQKIKTTHVLETICNSYTPPFCFKKFTKGFFWKIKGVFSENKVGFSKFNLAWFWKIDSSPLENFWKNERMDEKRFWICFGLYLFTLLEIMCTAVRKINPHLVGQNYRFPILSYLENVTFLDRLKTAKNIQKRN